MKLEQIIQNTFKNTYNGPFSPRTVFYHSFPLCLFLASSDSIHKSLLYSPQTHSVFPIFKMGYHQISPIFNQLMAYSVCTSLPYIRFSLSQIILVSDFTETALIKATNSLLITKTKGCILVLILLNLSIAPDIVEYAFLEILIAMPRCFVLSILQTTTSLLCWQISVESPAHIYLL